MYLIVPVGEGAGDTKGDTNGDRIVSSFSGNIGGGVITGEGVAGASTNEVKANLICVEGNLMTHLQ